MMVSRNLHEDPQFFFKGNRAFPILKSIANRNLRCPCWPSFIPFLDIFCVNCSFSWYPLHCRHYAVALGWTVLEGFWASSTRLPAMTHRSVDYHRLDRTTFLKVSPLVPTSPPLPTSSCCQLSGSENRASQCLYHFWGLSKIVIYFQARLEIHD